MNNGLVVVKRAVDVGDEFLEAVSQRTRLCLEEKCSSVDEMILLGRKLSLEKQQTVVWKKELVDALGRYGLIRKDIMQLNISRGVTKLYGEIFLWRSDDIVEEFMPEHSNEKYESYVCFTDVQVKSLIDFLDRNLGQRKSQILQYRFGLKDGRVHTLDEVGKVFGISANRIRQVEENSLRELRVYKRRIPKIFESDADIRKAEELIRRIKEVRQSLVFLEELRLVNELRGLSFSPFSMTGADVGLYTRGTALDNVPVDDLGLTPETCRNLHNDGILTLGELLENYDVEPDSRNRSYGYEPSEVRAKLKKLLYGQNFSYAEPVFVRDLGFSTRTFNCLSRAGIVTVDEILDKADKLIKIRNLGVRGVEEISRKLQSLGYTDFNPRLS